MAKLTWFESFTTISKYSAEITDEQAELRILRPRYRTMISKKNSVSLTEFLKD